MTGWDALERALRWVVAALALLALWLPAFTATVPFVAPQSWSIAGLGAATARALANRDQGEAPASVGHLLRQIEEVRQQFPSRARTVPFVYKLAVAIPAAAIAAGFFAILAVVFALWRRNRAHRVAALISLLAAAYAATMAGWLTAAARADLGTVLARVQGNLGAAGWSSLEAGVLTRVGFLPEIGLYLLLLADFAMLLLPQPNQA